MTAGTLKELQEAFSSYLLSGDSTIESLVKSGDNCVLFLGFEADGV